MVPLFAWVTLKRFVPISKNQKNKQKHDRLRIENGEQQKQYKEILNNSIEDLEKEQEVENKWQVLNKTIEKTNRTKAQLLK